MADPLMPQNVITWIQARNWGQHHEQWHAVRQWDRQSDQIRNWMLAQGWQRATVQEGEPGNGFQFLLMHRAMLQLLREAFPADAVLFQGWATPPTDPQDPNDPLPNGSADPFDSNMLTAITNIEHPPAEWQSDDDFGLYVETAFRPDPSNSFRQSADPTTGLHNYLHVRFSDPDSPVDMGSPRVNLGNQRFWRLHGWIDAQWSAFRTARGLLDTDPAYAAALKAAREEMAGMPGMQMEVMGATALAAVATMPVAPQSVARPFAMTLSKQFAALSKSIPQVQSINDLELLLQLALKIEHYTIPVYLSAFWSVKAGTLATSASAPIIRGIIREVVRQEMLHMGIVCNLLKGIDRKPQILASVPAYPDCLPGIDLAAPIQLERLSLEQVAVFRQIEHPSFKPVIIPRLEFMGALAPLSFKTIGDLYQVIADGFAFLKNQGKLTSLKTTGQLKDDEFGVPGQLDIYATIDDALAAVDLIRGQGEGRRGDPAQPGPGQGDLAHYYLFGQIIDGLQYVKQPDGSYKQDPSKPLAFPPPGDIYNMAPIPLRGYPGVSDDFDQAYSDTVRLLDDAWNGTGGEGALSEAHDKMLELSVPAIQLMKTPRKLPYSGGNFGPSFRFLPAKLNPPGIAPAAAPPAVAGVPAGAPVAAAATGYARIQQILDAAVNDANIGAHGPFWRTLDRDGFVAKAVFGRPLLAKKADGTFDEDASNLVMALEGRAPFDGTLFERMPVGFPQVPQAQIDEIRAWIIAGCPAIGAPLGAPASPAAAIEALGVPVAAPPAPPSVTVDLTAGGPQPGDVHNRFWRTLDAWSLMDATPQTTDDVLSFMDLARSAWLGFAQDPAQLGAWQAAIGQPGMAQAIGRLEQAQRITAVSVYGSPLAFLSMLDGFEKFGRDDLPNDPIHGSDPRHRMDGRTQWFVWGAFADACLRLGGAIPTDFWSAMLRAILAGMLNDGLFRGRFAVQGFSKDAAGAAAIDVHVRSLKDNQLQDQLVQRFQQTGLPGI